MTPAETSLKGVERLPAIKERATKKRPWRVTQEFRSFAFALFALLVESVEYRGKLLSLGGIRINFL